jgi:hypothetical protein
MLTDIAALCLTDFIDWRYIHSLVGIFDPACELFPPWTKEIYLCTVAPPFFSLTSSPPSQTKCTVYTDSVCLRGVQTLLRWRDGKNSDPGSGMEKSRIWDKHPGSATLGLSCKENNLLALLSL